MILPDGRGMRFGTCDRLEMEKIKQIEKLKQGLSTAFINQNISSNLAYKPQFVSNNYKEGRKVISSIEDELLSCEEFAMQYITMVWFRNYTNL